MSCDLRLRNRINVLDHQMQMSGAICSPPTQQISMQQVIRQCCFGKVPKGNVFVALVKHSSP
jgi:hypothetical protein